LHPDLVFPVTARSHFLDDGSTKDTTKHNNYLNQAQAV
jgi:hypothetical protein